MDHSRHLRCEQTNAEHLLWQRPRNHQLGVKFRRQHRIGGYIVDFICLEAAVVMELDGGQHLEHTAHSAERSAFLNLQGLKVLRFWNDDALLRTDAVLNEIRRGLLERERGSEKEINTRYSSNSNGGEAK